MKYSTYCERKSEELSHERRERSLKTLDEVVHDDVRGHSDRMSMTRGISSFLWRKVAVTYELLHSRSVTQRSDPLVITRPDDTLRGIGEMYQR